VAGFRPGLSFLVVGAVWFWSAGCEGLQADDRGGELGGPGPRDSQAQPCPPAAADDAPGGGEQAQPQPFGFPGAGGAVHGEHLHPGGRLAGHGHQLTPDLILGEPVQREVAQAGVFGIADASRRSFLRRSSLQLLISSAWAMPEDDYSLLTLRFPGGSACPTPRCSAVARSKDGPIRRLQRLPIVQRTRMTEGRRAVLARAALPELVRLQAWHRPLAGTQPGGKVSVAEACRPRRPAVARLRDSLMYSSRLLG